MQALGSSDLHGENWICSDGYPVLIDLETVLSPIPRVFTDKCIFPQLLGEENSFLYDVNHSLLPSGILPAMTGNREMSVLLDSSHQTHCLPVWKERKYTVLGYEEDFLAGFAEGYRRCLENRAALIAVLEEFRELPVRRIMRNILPYEKLLRSLQSPQALVSEEARRTVTARLRTVFCTRGAEHLLSIAQWEENCLLEGDIPYFSVLGDGHDLLGYGNVVAEKFMAKSAVENARERIGRLSEAEGRFELSLLRQSILRAVIPVSPGEETGVGSGLTDLEPMDPEEALQEVQELFGLVERLMLTGPSGKASWMSMIDGRAGLTAAKPTLFYGTAGMGIFFAAVHAAGGEEAVRAGELAETGWSIFWVREGHGKYKIGCCSCWIRQIWNRQLTWMSIPAWPGCC